MPTNSCQLHAVIWKRSRDLWSSEPAEGAKSPAEPTALLAISKYRELSPWPGTAPHNQPQVGSEKWEWGMENTTLFPESGLRTGLGEGVKSGCS